MPPHVSLRTNDRDFFTDKPLSSQRNQLESPLLRLPAELRNQIYGYCLLHSSTLRFRWKVAGYGGPGEALDKGAAFSAGITFACRQTRAETASVTPVKSVTFECRQNTSIINDFVSRCTAAELEAVTSICITRDKFHSSTGWATSHYQGFKFLRLFPSLHKLAIVLKVHGNHNGAGNSYFMTRYILSEMGERFKDSIIDEVTAITTSVAVVVEVRYRDLVASA
jgi:hypothetical protein